MYIRKYFKLILLLLITGLIKIFSLFPKAVEYYYSDGLYLVISKAQRWITSWFPFSVGDILYFAAGLYLLVRSISFFKKFFRRSITRAYLFYAARTTLNTVLFVYILFNILWGLNYNRVGIAQQLGLQKEKVETPDLVNVMEEIVTRINELDVQAHQTRVVLKTKWNLFDGSIKSYSALERRNSLFKYSVPSIKPSLYSYLGNYMGFTGYYNPFSGEAQVNTTVPVYIQPFTTCHEIGHQLGYAKESEANFAGYLSASSSDNPSFKYSAYFDLYLYGRRYIYLLDSIKGKQLDSTLNPGIRKDIRELREFVRSHANPVERLIDLLYSEFLKANEQPSGRVSYSEVILWVIAYYKKYGTV